MLKSDLNESCLSDAVLRLEYGEEGQSGEETASSQKIRSEKYLRQMILPLSASAEPPVHSSRAY